MTSSPLQSSRIRHGVYGVLGHHIAYSLSPMIFRRVFDALSWPAVYALFDLPPRRFQRFLAAAVDAGIVGFSVTQPYKVRIMSHLDRIDATAKAVGAVNTVVCRGQRLIGYNTDIDGVETALRPYRRALGNRSAVILGAGGGARAVAYTLAQRFGVDSITFAVRSLSKGRRLLQQVRAQARLQCSFGLCPLESSRLRGALSEVALLVNATPVGGETMMDRTSLPRSVPLPPSLIVFDLVYRPRPTRLLRNAQRTGCRTIDGWGMLVAQAEAAFVHWTGQRFPSRVHCDLMTWNE